MRGQRARQSGLPHGGRYDHPDLLVDPVAHRRDSRGQVHRMGGRMTTSCIAKVWTGYQTYVCGKPAKFGDYCGIHNPERIAKKRAEQDAKWESEWSAKKQALATQQRINDSHPLLVAALENLLALIDGHRVTVGDCNQAVAALKAAKGEE